MLRKVRRSQNKGWDIHDVVSPEELKGCMNLPKYQK